MHPLSRAAVTGLKRRLGTRADLVARLRAFGLLALLVPVFSAFGVAAEQGVPRVEIQLVPREVLVHVTVEVPIEVSIERVVERVVYVPVPMQGFSPVRTILTGPLLRPIPGAIPAAGSPGAISLPGVAAGLSLGIPGDGSLLSDPSLSGLTAGLPGSPGGSLLPGPDAPPLALGNAAVGAVPAVELRAQPNGVAIGPALGAPFGLPAGSVAGPASGIQAGPSGLAGVSSPDDEAIIAPESGEGLPLVVGTPGVPGARQTPQALAQATRDPNTMLRAQSSRTPGGTPVTVLEVNRESLAAPTATPQPAPPAAAAPAPAPPSAPAPKATAEPTRERPSEPPKATNTPTPKPTNTPAPQATNTPTPKPTKTPVPPATRTPTPRPTNTPVPQPTKTPTPKPTNTPVPPTKTPVPQATKTPTPKPHPTSTPVKNRDKDEKEKNDKNDIRR